MQTTIALWNVLCKLIEKIVNKRLTWFLEKNNIIINQHSGFRTQRSIQDQIYSLTVGIETAFCNKQRLIAILFDLEKAFETTPK